MELESEIKELDRLVAWGAKIGKISGKLLQGFQEVIKRLVELNEKEVWSETERDIQLRLAYEKVDKLRIICRKAGFTEKAIEEMILMDDKFLEHYPYTVQSEMDFQLLRSFFRNVSLAVERDMGTLAVYEGLVRLKKEQMDMMCGNGEVCSKGTHEGSDERQDLIEKMLQHNRSMYGYLTPYFDQIEKGELDEIRGYGAKQKKVAGEIRDHHLRWTGGVAINS